MTLTRVLDNIFEHEVELNNKKNNDMNLNFSGEENKNNNEPFDINIEPDDDKKRKKKKNKHKGKGKRKHKHKHKKSKKKKGKEEADEMPMPPLKREVSTDDEMNEENIQIPNINNKGKVIMDLTGDDDDDINMPPAPNTNPYFHHRQTRIANGKRAIKTNYEGNSALEPKPSASASASKSAKKKSKTSKSKSKKKKLKPSASSSKTAKKQVRFKIKTEEDAKREKAAKEKAAALKKEKAEALQKKKTLERNSLRNTKMLQSVVTLSQLQLCPKHKLAKTPVNFDYFPKFYPDAAMRKQLNEMKDIKLSIDVGRKLKSDAATLGQYTEAVQLMMEDANDYQWTPIIPDQEDLNQINIKLGIASYDKYYIKTPSHKKKKHWGYCCTNCLHYPCFHTRGGIIDHQKKFHTKKKNNNYGITNILDSVKKDRNFMKFFDPPNSNNNNNTNNNNNNCKDDDDEQNFNLIADKLAEKYRPSDSESNGSELSSDDSEYTQNSSDEESDDNSDTDADDDADADADKSTNTNTNRNDDGDYSKHIDGKIKYFCGFPKCTRNYSNTTSLKNHKIEDHKIIPPGHDTHRQCAYMYCSRLCADNTRYRNHVKTHRRCRGCSKTILKHMPEHPTVEELLTTDFTPVGNHERHCIQFLRHRRDISVIGRQLMIENNALTNETIQLANRQFKLNQKREKPITMLTEAMIRFTDAVDDDGNSNKKKKKSKKDKKKHKKKKHKKKDKDDTDSVTKKKPKKDDDNADDKKKKKKSEKKKKKKSKSKKSKSKSKKIKKKKKINR